MAVSPTGLNKILVASDLSDQSGIAIRRAMELGREHAAEVIVVHVIDEDLPETARSFLTTTSDHYVRQIIATDPWARDLNVTINVVSGRPDIDIAERAEIAHADLIVVGLHTRLLEENLEIQGTVAERIIQATRLPVLVVKDTPRGPYRSVLVGLDFSPFSLAAVRTAMSVAADAKLHLVHAYEPISGLQHLARVREPGLSERIDAKWQSRMERFIDTEMQKLLDECPPDRRGGRMLSHISLGGSPHEVLLREAERTGAELIVIGAHGRTGLARLVLGSVSTELLNDRIADILVVRPF